MHKSIKEGDHLYREMLSNNVRKEKKTIHSTKKKLAVYSFAYVQFCPPQKLLSAINDGENE